MLGVSAERVEKTMSNPDESPRPESGPILVGLLFMFVGLAVLTDRLGLSGLHVSGRHWPMLLIIYGCVKLLMPPDRPDRRRQSRWTAAWIIYLGLWFFVNEFHLFGLWYGTSWPLLIVWAGVRMLSCAIMNAGRHPHQRIEES